MSVFLTREISRIKNLQKVGYLYKKTQKKTDISSDLLVMMVVRNVLITLPHLHTSNLDHKHGGTQDMASMVAPELNASHFFHFMEVDRLDLVHAFLQVRLCVQHVICRNITAEREAEDEDFSLRHCKLLFSLGCSEHLPDFDVVRKQPAVNGFGRVGHECPPFITSFLQKPRQSPTVIQMKAKRERRKCIITT